MPKMTRAQIEKAKDLAEKLKGKPDITNPHALARWKVQHTTKKTRRGA